MGNFRLIKMPSWRGFVELFHVQILMETMYAHRIIINHYSSIVSFIK